MIEYTPIYSVVYSTAGQGIMLCNDAELFSVTSCQVLAILKPL